MLACGVCRRLVDDLEIVMDDLIPVRVDRVEVASLGGLARAKQLSPEQRSEIARRGAAKRWDAPRAVTDGLLTIAGRRISCAVLNTKVRVLTQQTFLTAIGRAAKAKGGKGSERLSLVDGLPPFLAAHNLEPYISDELRRAATPVVFRTLSGGTAYGYDAHLLPLVCSVYQRARDAHMQALQAYQRSTTQMRREKEFKGVLLRSQEHIVRACDLLIRDLATDGIIAMVDRATGYVDPEMLEERHRLLKAIVPGHLLPWVERFPEEFFKQIYRLYGWAYKPGCAKRPQCIGNFINKYIYGQFPEGTLELIQSENPVLASGRRGHRNHQRLSLGTGIPILDHQVTSTTTILALTDAGAGTQAFDSLFYKVYPKPLPKARAHKKLAVDPTSGDQPSLFPDPPKQVDE